MAPEPQPMNCASCTTTIPGGSRFCPQCGRSVTSSPADQATRTQMHWGSSEPSTTSRRSTRRSSTGTPGGAAGLASSADIATARFLPGTVVAERYRIVGLLGRGGMGEVYRADDLTLDQTVALKFLPEGFESSPSRVERFLDEVRVARQIAHANVCRVHDVGEVDGQHFLTMEYVDGEDLSSLLRRIGRLPHDKAVQIARQLCAGVAAAHERGILHRDLKPSNVMIDGRGHVRITDFGLAGVAESFSGSEIRSGTPDYMSPEQLAGREVSSRSDVYALGHVLYELFTGSRAFRADTLAELARLQSEVPPSRPSTLVEEMDPSVERIILRCLEKEPQDRPQSALAVAAALPGGDPLAAALAAGETPSPELLAAAGPQGGLRPGRALTLLAASVAGVIVLGFGASTLHLHGKVPLPKGRGALEENVRSIRERLGYVDDGVDRVAMYQVLEDPLLAMAHNDRSASRWAPLAEPGQRVVHFFSRQSQEHLAPSNLAGAVTAHDPYPEPGDVQVGVDLAGRLISLRAVVEPFWHGGDRPSYDWNTLFEAAGLDLASFSPVEPTLQPSLYSDERVAFSGTLPGGESVRIEAAAAHGKPVFFEIVDRRHPAWSAATAEERQDRALEAGAKAATVAVLVLVALIAGGAAYLAYRNSRLGRIDYRGALVLAALVSTMRMGDWLLGGHHVKSFYEEFGIVITVLGGALVVGGLTLVFYLALEPYIRKLLPEGLVSWTRLLKGRWRDPLVGRDALIGACFGVGLHVFSLVGTSLEKAVGMPPSLPYAIAFPVLAGGRWAVAQVFEVVLRGLASALAVTVLFLLLRIVLRRTWIAAAVFCAIFPALGLFQTFALEGAAIFEHPGGVALVILGNAIQGVALAYLVLRLGVLATVATFTISNVFLFYPITLDASAPYFSISLFALAAVVLFAVLAFRISLAGRPLFEGMLEAKQAS